MFHEKKKKQTKKPQKQMQASRQAFQIGLFETMKREWMVLSE